MYMSYKIIVSRYNENIDWLSAEMNNCIIYNKGISLGISNEIMLQNVGRESETYLNYIISNYNNLADVVIFTQANISDHIKHNNSCNYINYLLNFKNEAFANDKSYPTLTHYNTKDTSPFSKNWNLINGNYYLEDNYKYNQRVPFSEWFMRNIQPNYPEPLHIYHFGIFAVKKELILKKSLEYYKKLILEVNHHIDPAEGHFFERSWYYIFTLI